MRLSSGRPLNFIPADGGTRSASTRCCRPTRASSGGSRKATTRRSYEYLNDLACRRWLALAWPLVTENVRQSRAAELRSLDDRFKASTADDGSRSLGRFFTLEDGPEWWRRRRPVKARGDFAADLAEGD